MQELGARIIQIIQYWRPFNTDSYSQRPMVYTMTGRGLSKALKSYICPECSKPVKLLSRSYATAASPDIYDVVCVGGGPAGLSLLTALRTYNCTISFGFSE